MKYQLVAYNPTGRKRNVITTVEAKDSEEAALRLSYRLMDRKETKVPVDYKIQLEADGENVKSGEVGYDSRLYV